MKKLKILAILIFTLTLSHPVWAMSVKTLTLKQILGFSDKVFRGTVIDIKVEDDVYESGRLVKYFTLAVDECLKGTCGETVTFKQLANAPIGLPTYNLGENYLLFLPEATEKTGLLAPVGIQQGTYSIVEANGRLVVPALTKSVVSKGLGLAKGSKSLANTGDYESFKNEILNTMKEIQ